MIRLRKRHALSARARTLLPALAFLAFASVSAAGGGALAALCLVPAGLVLEIGGEDDDDSTPGDHEQKEAQRHV